MVKHLCNLLKGIGHLLFYKYCCVVMYVRMVHLYIFRWDCEVHMITWQTMHLYTARAFCVFAHALDLALVYSAAVWWYMQVESIDLAVKRNQDFVMKYFCRSREFFNSVLGQDASDCEKRYVCLIEQTSPLYCLF